MPTTTEASAFELNDLENEKGEPMSSFNHALAQMRIGIAFSAHSEFTVLPELTLELPAGERLTPDISVYPKTPADWVQDTIRMTKLPVLAVEILSPTQGFQEIADKLILYFAHGVKSVWVVQPGMQAIAIYLPGVNRPQVFTTGEAKDPVTGLTARLENIFAP